MNKWLIIALYFSIIIISAFTEQIIVNRIRRNKIAIKIRCCENIKITYQKNKGAMLGLLSKKRKMMLVLTTLFLILIVVLSIIVLLFTNGKYILKLGLLLLSAGAFSNAIERYIYKYVIDYLIFPKFFIKPIRNIVFNKADLLIFVGICNILLASIFDFSMYV